MTAMLVETWLLAPQPISCAPADGMSKAASC